MNTYKHMCNSVRRVCPQLGYLSVGELEARMARLDAEMEAEIELLRARYNRKRQPILDAIHLKRKRQQNF